MTGKNVGDHNHEQKSERQPDKPTEINNGEHVISKTGDNQAHQRLQVLQDIKTHRFSSPHNQFILTDDGVDTVDKRGFQKPAEVLGKTLIAQASPAVVSEKQKLIDAHPELHLNAVDKSNLQHETATLQAAVTNDVHQFQSMRTLVKHENALFLKHLHQATNTTDHDSPAKIQQELAKLPKAVRDKLANEEAHMRADNQSYLAIAHRLPQEQGDLFAHQARLNFENNLSQIEKLPPDQQKKIFDSLKAILEVKDPTHPIPESRRQEFAYALAEHIADPAIITQGQKDTCSVASIQTVLLEKDPGMYAQEAASIITHGSLIFNSGDGATKTSPRSEVLLSPAQLLNPDGCPERDPLSQAFQTAFADKLVKLYDPSKGYHYIDAEPGHAPMVLDGNPPTYRPSESGEYVTSKDGTNYPFLGGETRLTEELLGRLTGDKYHEQSEHPGNAAQFKHTLDHFGKKPPSLLGHTSESGPHIYTITKYDPKTGEVTVSDSANFRSEKPQVMSAEQLYKKLAQEQNEYLSKHPSSKVSHPNTLDLQIIYE